jgi:hypothetical protein
MDMNFHGQATSALFGSFHTHPWSNLSTVRSCPTTSCHRSTTHKGPFIGWADSKRRALSWSLFRTSLTRKYLLCVGPLFSCFSPRTDVFETQAIPCVASAKQSVTGTVLYPSTSGCSCQYHSTMAKDTYFIHMQPAYTSLGIKTVVKKQLLVWVCVCVYIYICIYIYIYIYE